MLKLHSFLDASSAGRLSGHAIINGLSFSADRAVSVGEFAKRAKQICAGLDSHPPPSRGTPTDSFGDKLKRAVQTRLAARSGHKTVAASGADDEDFAEKLKKAVKKKVAQRTPQPAPSLRQRKASRSE